eukprot:c4118_g1_i1.p1 GENE.c4118_g1_i1~~c4118_g1_i1.p1  ORF type:complete len:462 (+),score=92.96 c4118_g1_i1:19-1404(+)
MLLPRGLVASLRMPLAALARGMGGSSGARKMAIRNAKKEAARAAKLVGLTEVEDNPMTMDEAPEGTEESMIAQAVVDAHGAAEDAEDAALDARLNTTLVGKPMEEINFDFHLRENTGKLQFLGKSVTDEVLPTGFTVHGARTSEFFGGGMVCLTRPPLRRVTESMFRFEGRFAKAAGARLPYNPSIVLDGERGVGKSHVLEMATIWAKQRGWRVIYVPNTWDIANRSQAVYKSRVTGLQDQPDMAQGFIERLLKDNEPWMRTVKVPGPESLGPEPKATAARVSLVELAKVGLRTDNLATEVALAIQGRFVSEPGPPLLLAIDSFNSMFDKTNFDDGRKNTKNYVRARDLALCNALIKTATEPLPGVALVSVTGGRPVTNQYFEAAEYKATLAKFRTRMRLGPYDKDELAQIVQEYYRLGLVSPDKGDVVDGKLADGYLAYVAALSANVPEKVFKVMVSIML